jgi:hypothetical protein
MHRQTVPLAILARQSAGRHWRIGLFSVLA